MRRSFASTVSLLAMTATITSAPMVARAQSFNATGTIVAGAGAIQTAPNTTSVFTDAPSVVINWTPTDTTVGGGPINFQSAGTTATFANRDATTLNVLNRILPVDVSRPVVFNGTVISQLVDLATGVGTRGGTLFFYSPGGILVSSSGVFDVGNLALSASDLAFDPTSGAFGTGGTYSFLAANAGSRVEIQNGARIVAGPTSAYVTLIAPKVVQSGTIDVDGSAVIVAADASTITFRPNGLFDIQIDQGTSAAGEVVTNDGTITGPVGTINTAHRVYMVAVPRNDAITMAIKAGSSLGFDVAGAADVDGNAIVLSAGYGVTGGAIDLVRSAAGGAVPAALALGAITATSQVSGKATGQASLTVDSGNTSNFASNLSLSGVRDPAAATDDGAFISVGGVGSTLDLTGNLQLTALDAGQVAGAAITDSGNASVTVDQGTLTIGGSATISSARAPTVDLDALAGTASLAARGGATVSVGGDLTISARAEGIAGGTAGPAAPPTGPNAGTGGTAQLSLEGASTVTIRGNMLLDASGVGGSALLDGLVGANGTGGRALIDGKAGGGTLGVGGGTTLDARGFGGDGQRCISCTVEGGTGTGGSASVIAATGATFTLDGLLGLDASGRGGSAATDGGNDGGAAQGGSAFVRSTGGRINTAQSLVVRAEGLGGAGATVNAFASGLPGSGGTGGKGTGGVAGLIAGDASTIGGGGLISSVSDTVVSSQGIGGNGGNGGDGVGGTSAVSARNGTVTGTALEVRASGTGGNGFNGGNGGAGQGTSAEVIAYSALEGNATVTFSGVSVNARGDGGTGSSPAFFDAPGGAGGNGTGGSARALAEAGNGALSLGETSLNASGNGGNGGDGFTVSSIPITGQNGGAGGTGRAGTAQIGVVSGLDTGAVNTGSAEFAAVSVTARGTGGNGGAASAGASTPGAAGNGGAGYGGGASLVAQGGRVTITAPALVDAGGIGGSTGLGGTAGNGFVGDAGAAPLPLGARLEVGSRSGQPAQRGALVATDLTFLASAETGKGGTPGNATLLGHPLTWVMNGGTIDAANLTFSSVGTDLAAPPSLISLANGSTQLTGALTFNTQGTLTATLDGADVRTRDSDIRSADWILGAAPAGTPGTLFATNSFAISSGDNLLARLSINSTNSPVFGYVRDVRLDDITTDGNIGLPAVRNAQLGNLTAQGSVVVAAQQSVVTGNVRAGTTVNLGANINVTAGSVVGNGGILIGGGGNVITASLTSGEIIRASGDNLTIGGAVTAGDSAFLIANSQATVGNVSAGLVAPSASPTAAYRVVARGLTGLTIGDISAAQDVFLGTTGTLGAGNIAGRDVAVLGSAGGQTLGATTASGRVLLTDYAMRPVGGPDLTAYDFDALFAATPVKATGPISVGGPVRAGSLVARTVGNLSLQDITTTTAGGATGIVDLLADGALTAGGIDAAGDVLLRGGPSLTASTVTTLGIVDVAATGTVQLGDVSGSGTFGVNGIRVSAGPSLVIGRTLANAGDIVLSSAGSITSLTLDTIDGQINLTSGGAMNLGTLTSSNQISLTSGGALGAGGLLSQTGVLVNGSAAVVAGRVTATTGTASLTAATSLTTGDVDASDGITLTSTSGDLAAGVLTSANGPIGITSGRNIALSGDAVSQGGNVTVFATGGIAARGLSAQGDLSLTSTGTITTANLGASGQILVSAAGAVTVGAVDAASDVALISDGLLTAGGVTTLESATLRGTAGAALNGNVVTGSSLTVSSDGIITGRGLSAGIASQSAATGAFYDVTVVGLGGIALGDVAAAADIKLFSPLAVTASALSGREVAVLSGGDQRVASISATGRTLLADYSMAPIGGIPLENYNIDLLLSAAPVASTGAITVTGLTGAGAFTAASRGAISVGSVSTVPVGSADGRVNLRAGGALATGGIVAGGALDLAASGALGAGSLIGAADVNVTGLAGVTVGNVQAANGAAKLTARNNLAAGSITAANQIALTSTTGGVQAGALTSVNSSITANSAGAMDIVSANAATVVSLSSGGVLTAGDLAGVGGVTIAGLGAVTTGLLSATGGNVLVTAAGDLATGAVSADGLVTLTSSGGALSAGDVRALGGTVTLSARNAATAGIVGASADVVATAGGNLRLASALSDTGDVSLTATGGNVLTGDLTATAGRVLVSASGSAALGNLSAAGLASGVGLSVTTGTTLSAGNAGVTAGDLRLVSGGAMATGDLAANAGLLTINSGGTLQTGALAGSTGIALTAAGNATVSGAATSAGGDVTLDVTGQLAAGDIRAATGLVGITTTGAATTGALSAGTSLGLLSTGGSVATLSAAAATGVSLVATGDLQTGAVSGGGTVRLGGRNVLAGAVDGAAVSLGANGTLGVGNVTARTGDVAISATDAVTGGAITAAGRIALSNFAGGVTLGNLAAGSTVLINGTGNVQVGDASAGQSTVELRANGGSLTAGSISAITDTALLASGDVAVGAVRASDILLLGGGSIRAAALTSADGRILGASNALGLAGGAIGEFNFDAVFAQPLVAAGGGLTLTGAVSGATFAAAVTGDAATQGISATRSIFVDAGGTARLTGVWQSPVIELRASDLDLPTGAGLNAGLTGTITLVSRNVAGMRIGDGLDGSVVPTSGFSLDNAEWSRINSGSFFVSAPDVAGPVDILIGKLDVTGPDAGSTIDDPLGSVQFTTGATAAGTFGGTIRVAGALATTGFRATNALVFRTGQFQLASDTGSIAVQGKSAALAGTLRINARDIHVAAGSLLAPLAADPFFSGVEPALDQVSAGGNGPVLRAGALDFIVGRSFYIQRTGAGFDPLGFEEPLDAFTVTQAGAAQIAVIINGTFRTATGLVSGAAAWRLFKNSGFDFSGFTADSRLNGCLLTAATCGVSLQPDPGIRTIIEWVDKPILDNTPFDPENPPPRSLNAIVPPPLLLPVQPDALPGQVDEPIAGSGNPALIAGGGLEGARP